MNKNIHRKYIGYRNKKPFIGENEHTGKTEIKLVLEEINIVIIHAEKMGEK